MMPIDLPPRRPVVLRLPASALERAAARHRRRSRLDAGALVVLALVTACYVLAGWVAP